MAGFFSPDNWYWKPFSHAADAVILSCMWTLTSVPLFTCGAATTALYDTVAHCVRGREKDLFDRFFSTFKRELKPAFLISALWGCLLFILCQGIRAFTALLPATNGSVLLVCGMLFIFSLAVGIFSWVLPLQSRFTFSIGALNVTAVRLACGHPFRTVSSGVVTVLTVFLCLRTVFSFMILPEILSVIWAALMEPVFKQYMTEQEQMAVTKCPDDEEDAL